MTKKPTSRARELNSIISNLKAPYDYQVTKEKLAKADVAREIIFEAKTEVADTLVNTGKRLKVI